MDMLKNTKRIAFFLPGLYGGGAERVMINLAVGLMKDGCDIDFVLAQSEGPFLSEVPPSMRLIKLNPRRLGMFRTLSSLPALIRYLRLERPDALLSALHANYIALWAKRLSGVPLRLVISEHNTFSKNLENFSNWNRRMMVYLTFKFYPWADEIVAVSSGVADDLSSVSGVPRDRIKVIYNPIITPELKQKVKEPLDVHLQFDSAESPVIISIGRLVAQKDFSTLIKAFAQVRRSRQARLIILGEGVERGNLEALIRHLDLEKDVFLPGFVLNPYSLLSRAALFVLPSIYEGLPTVLVEALFCGIPIIATDCPYGPLEILQGGRFGRLIPVKNVNLMAQSIEAGLNGEIPRPPLESWQPFTEDTIVKQYREVLLGI
jgi:glycosyltransferase involved in cell wall biosynthesis